MATISLHPGALATKLITAAGGVIHPDDFHGQKLVLFLCPKDDADAASREIESYCALADQFEKAGVWVIGVRNEREAGLCRAMNGGAVQIVHDADGCAYSILAELLPRGGETAHGASFLFGREGTVRNVWASSGHADEVLKAARERP